MKTITKCITMLIIVFATSSTMFAQSISISPDRAQRGQRLDVLISGQGTHFQQSSPPLSLWFSQASSRVNVMGFSVLSDISIVANLDVPSQTDLGLEDFNIYGDIDGTLTLTDAFTVTPLQAVLHSVTPNSAYQGERLSVTLTSQSLTFGQNSGTFTWLTKDGSAIASLHNILISNNQFYNPDPYQVQSVAFDIPPSASSGSYDVHTFSESDGELVIPNGFTVLQPGDWTSDGMVNLNDLDVVADNWLAGVPLEFYNFPLDSDPGWTTEGQWSFGQPTGNGGSEQGNPDPSSGFSGTNVYGVNLNGDYDNTVTGGPYYLTTGPLDCSAHHGVLLKMGRWLNSDFPPYVDNKIEVSNNGAIWKVVWEQQESVLVTDPIWRKLMFDISSIADNQPTVFIRWSYEIVDGSRAVPYSGWNIDNIVLSGIR